jgi:hypothetical protein
LAPGAAAVTLMKLNSIEWCGGGFELIVILFALQLFIQNDIFLTTPKRTHNIFLAAVWCLVSI